MAPLVKLKQIWSDLPGVDDTAIDRWRQYCLDVSAAAEQLRKLAADAAGKAEGSALIAREIYGGPAPAPRVRNVATMMLGPFAALEELRQQLTRFTNR